MEEESASTFGVVWATGLAVPFFDGPCPNAAVCSAFCALPRSSLWHVATAVFFSSAFIVGINFLIFDVLEMSFIIMNCDLIHPRVGQKKVVMRVLLEVLDAFLF